MATNVYGMSLGRVLYSSVRLTKEVTSADGRPGGRSRQNGKQKTSLLDLSWCGDHGPGHTLSAFLGGFRVDSSKKTPEKQVVYSHDSRVNHWLLLWTPAVEYAGFGSVQ